MMKFFLNHSSVTDLSLSLGDSDLSLQLHGDVSVCAHACSALITLEKRAATRHLLCENICTIKCLAAINTIMYLI